MPYPPVIQLETRAREAEAQATLALERRAERRTSDRGWLPLHRLRARPAVQLKLRDCER